MHVTLRMFFAALLQVPLPVTREVELRELACVTLQAPCRPESSKDVEPDLDSLSWLHRVLIAADGRVLVHDAYDGALHVFDEMGARVQLIEPPEPHRNWRATMAVDASGRIFVEDGDETEDREPFAYVYAPDGTFLERWFYAPESEKLLPLSCLAFSPRTDARWERRYTTDEWVRVVKGCERERWQVRPDFEPWRHCPGEYLADDRFVVFDSYAPPVPGCFGPDTRPRPRPDLLQYVFVFGSDGGWLERFVLPEQPRLSGPWCGKEWVCFTAGVRELRLLHLPSATLCAAHLPKRDDALPEEDRRMSLVVRPDGREELWIVEHEARRLLRYALP